MAKSNNQKAKILYLEKMLRETGEHHAISMQTILANLMEHGIRAERKSIYDDVEVLREFGMDILYSLFSTIIHLLVRPTCPDT